MLGCSSSLQRGCRRTPAQPGQQAHEASGTEPVLFTARQRLVMDPNSLHKPDSHPSEFVPYGQHKESLPGEACALGASGHW